MQVKKVNSFEELEVLTAEVGEGGLFQTVSYLKSFNEQFKGEVIRLGVYEGDRVVGYGVFEVVEGKVLFLGMKPVLGKQEVTDYGDIVCVGDYRRAWKAILKWFKKEGYKKVQLDYVREDSETYKGLKEKGKVEEQEISPYIELPKTWSEYLEKLERKHRKELRRKIERLEESKGYYQCSEETVKQDFEDFIKLHRLSDPEKNKFMSEEMKDFFWKVKTMKVEGWQSHLCFLRMDDEPVASVICFENKSEVWLYNSGFDPEYGYYSVGLLLKAYKIKKAIEEGKKRYDFLRGDERYKYELGGKDLKLYKIETSF